MKKKNPKENQNIVIMVEINCPNCNMISYIGPIRTGETKIFSCQAGEASCGWTWKQKFKFNNVHDYDIETYGNGKWGKTNWGGKDKKEVLKRAEEIAISFAKKIGSLGKIRDGVRVVDRQDNILFKWERNE